TPPAQAPRPPLPARPAPPGHRPAGHDPRAPQALFQRARRGQAPPPHRARQEDGRQARDREEARLAAREGAPPQGPRLTAAHAPAPGPGAGPPASGPPAPGGGPVPSSPPRMRRRISTRIAARLVETAAIAPPSLLACTTSSPA